MDISGIGRRRARRRADRDRLPLRGRLRRPRPRARRGAARHEARRHRSSSPTTLPERFGEQAGTEVAFRALVKDAKRKVLPELTDEWVAEVTEFETIEALREDEPRAASTCSASSRRRWRCATACSTSSSGLVTSRRPSRSSARSMERRLHDLVHRLEAPGPRRSRSTSPRPARTRRRSSSGSARAPTKAVLADLASPGGRRPGGRSRRATRSWTPRSTAWPSGRAKSRRRVRRDLDRRGLLEAVRSDIARGKALQFVVDHATVVDSDGDAIDLTLPSGMPTPIPTLQATQPPKTEAPEPDPRRGVRSVSSRSTTRSTSPRSGRRPPTAASAPRACWASSSRSGSSCSAPRSTSTSPT